MKKSDKIVSKILQESCLNYADNIQARLYILEQLLRHIIDNELSHIWLFIKLILGGLVAIFGTLLTAVLLGK